MFFEPEDNVSFCQILKKFLAVHWRGLVCIFAPLILLCVLLPEPQKSFKWCAYCLLLMAVFWVTECIPLAVTSFLPVVLFPLTGVMTTREVCKAYLNDSVLMFLGSIMLAYAVEQSGLHKRLAYCAIRVIGYSHVKLVLAMCVVTTFVSMWVTNTAATTMMVPINFAVLKVFDDQKIIKMYEINSSGDKVASDITTAYFCAASFSATIGGIGTLVGTATNIAFKGLFHSAYPEAPEYLSFPLFSGFAIPYMIVLEMALFFCIVVQYFGFLRPSSEAAERAIITKAGKELAEKAIGEDSAKMGKFSFREGVVAFLFTAAMVCFFCRSPKVFSGWADLINKYYMVKDKNFIRDSTLAFLICSLLFLLPATYRIIDNFRVKYRKDLPGRIPSVLEWQSLNAAMPFSFMFLLGGGFALSEAANTSGLNAKIGEHLNKLQAMPHLLVILFIIIVVIFITNFASNVAVANVMAPLAMQMARETSKNPLWYCLAAGFAASFCFMVPVGTPGNLVIQSAASIPTSKMMKAGAAPTLFTIFFSWIFVAFYAPVIWPILNVNKPKWL